MMVAALPFGGVITPFTSDVRAHPTRGRARRRARATRTETGSELACRTRRFLESVDQFLRGRGAPPIPQTLVLFTAGLAAPRRDSPNGLAPGMCELQSSLPAGRAAAGLARAKFYMLQPADIGMPRRCRAPTLGGVGDPGSDNPLEGIEHLAGVTNGVRLSLDATGTASLQRVARKLERTMRPSSNRTPTKCSAAAARSASASRAAASPSVPGRRSRSSSTRDRQGRASPCTTCSAPPGDWRSAVCASAASPCAIRTAAARRHAR